jgi:hypothetical protein
MLVDVPQNLKHPGGLSVRYSAASAEHELTALGYRVQVIRRQYCVQQNGALKLSAVQKFRGEGLMPLEISGLSAISA